jgi:FkbM family methyltransferase
VEEPDGFHRGWARTGCNLAGRLRTAHIRSLRSPDQIADEESSVRTHTAEWLGFTFHHRNEPEFELLSREISEGGEYWFASDKRDPTILDCGSHIGLSVAWFKRRFPNARIIAFEPDPQNFRLLQTNVAFNGLEGVELLNVAVSSRRGTARLFGDFGVAAPMASAHSLRQEWGTQRSEQWILVNTVPLADYITGPVDYLKLDIEGMETERRPVLGDRVASPATAGGRLEERSYRYRPRQQAAVVGFEPPEAKSHRAVRQALLRR